MIKGLISFMLVSLMLVGLTISRPATAQAQTEINICVNKYSDLYWKNRYVLHFFLYDFTLDFLRSKKDPGSEQRILGLIYELAGIALKKFIETGCFPTSELQEISSEMAKSNNPDILSEKKNFDIYFFNSKDAFNPKE